MKKVFISLIFLVTFGLSFSQVVTNMEALNQLSNEYKQTSDDQKTMVADFLKKNNIPKRIESDSSLMELMYIDENSQLQYNITHNENAAKTISTNEVYSGGAAGLSLTGTGVNVREWDGGTVLSTHQEFDTRLTNGDATATHYHATHVAGTIMASGVVSTAKGMAYAASLTAYDWNDDNSEMATEASAGALVSNHSYGSVRGWNDGTWYGDPVVSTAEDYLFGFYDSQAKAWDDIAYNAPFYLIVKSAGNDRNDVGDGSYPNDGPYDCIGQRGIAKNILTVGAVNDITGGWTQASDVVISSFSSWGPADDGRIKPDIVGNGVTLYSAYNTGNSDYSSMSGTSMSAPSVTGSIALLIQHYENVVGSGSKMKAATTKALVIHTSDEAGTNNGPDYQFGWGLMNTQTAAEKITEDQTTDVIMEHYLKDGETYTRNITTTGTSPIKVTIVWTDPSGTSPANSLDPADVILVNDLDLLITQASNTYYPWKLDKDNPSNAATQAAENNVDNVEMIDISSPSNSTTYTITVDNDGTLSGGGQAFSMIISGDISNAVAPEADFYADDLTPNVEQEVVLYDASAHIPTSWLWSFSPATINYLNSTSSTSQNPQVEFTVAGTYEVSLYVANANGNDTETKTGYITVAATPGYCNASTSGGYGSIGRVQLGSIDNSSGYSSGGYGDYTAQTTDLAISSSNSITVTSPYSDGSLDLGIWIDWNQDGDFEDTDEEVLCGIDNSGEGTFSISVPATSELGSTRMRLRIKYHGSTCSSCGSTSNGEVEDYSVNITASSTTWTGTTSTEWATSTNWNGNSVPIESNNVTIPSAPSGGVYPVIGSGTTDAQCYDLSIESGASLSIAGYLTVGGTITNSAGNNGIVIESSSSSNGSLLTDTDGVSATIKRYLSGGKWHLISAPVSGASANSIYFGGSPEVYLKSYNESDDTWDIIVDAGTSMSFGQGFATWVQTGNNATGSFSGSMKATDLTLSSASAPPMAFTDISHGYNLIGNPFSTAIDWDQGGWTRTNIDGTAYVWKDGSNYLTRNLYGQGSLTNGIIPVGQGFFVQTTGGSPSITIPKASRVHAAQAYHSDPPNENDPPYAVFNVISEDENDEVWITFSSDATDAYDSGWDGYKRFGDGTAPQLYVNYNDINLSIAAFSLLDDNGKTIPLYFEARKNAEHTLIFNEQLNLEEVDIFLEDLRTGDFQDMNIDTAYTFNGATYNNYNRFLLHFNPVITDIIDFPEYNGLQIYSWNKTVYIRNTDIDAELKDVQIQIFDMYGRQLDIRKMSHVSMVKIPVQVNNSYLIVKVVSDGSSSVRKVFVQ
jgi:subtilisin family serine protease